MDQPLTPGEALVLLEPNADIGREAAKVTFLALLAQGALRLEREPGRVFGSTTKIRPGPSRPFATIHQAPMHEAAVLEAVHNSRSGTIQDVTERLAKATGRFARFVDMMLRPPLIQRGLLAQHSHVERRKTLMFFKRTVTVFTYHPTEAGAREQARLRDLLAGAEGIRAALDSNPARAATMAAALGPMILLVPALLPFLGQLGHAMAMPNVLDGSMQTWDLSWFETAEAGVGDALDAALSDAESASDSDGDSDGDSGGSDGGGE
jgi:hypothetical protein